MTQTTLYAKVDHTLDAVATFSELLETETRALKTSNFAVFESLQDQKLILAQNYQDAILAFEEDIDLLPTLEESLKDKLKQSHNRFAAAAEENQIVLASTAKVSERVVSLIMTAARRSVSDGPSYSRGAIQGLSDKIPVHFKLNEVL